MRLFKKRQFNNYANRKKSKKTKLLIAFLVILVGLLLIFKQEYRYRIGNEQTTFIRPNTFKIEEVEETDKLKNNNQIVNKTNFNQNSLPPKAERPLIGLDLLIPVE